MEKNPNMSGNKPNLGNGSEHRHRYMCSSEAAGGVHGTLRNFNLKQRDVDNEKSFRRSRSFSGHPSKTHETLEASSSSSKLTTNRRRKAKTHPELLNRDDQRRHPVFNVKMNRPLMETSRANKLLVNVTAAHSIGPLRLLLSKDVTVEDVIKSTLLLYAKEGRRPLLTNNPAFFGLHYSQFSINRLKPADKVKDLGSCKFFLCAKATADENGRLSSQSGQTTPLSSCEREIPTISKSTEPWYRVAFYYCFKKNGIR